MEKNVVKQSEKSFIQRIVEFVKADDASKVTSFVGLALKKLNKTIENRVRAIAKAQADLKEQLEDMNEVLADYQEEMDTVAMSVDLTQIGTHAEREAYFTTYDYRISQAIGKVESQKKAIEAASKAADDLIKGYEADIAKTELKLSYLA
jgi:methionyl-tRNA synthetase